MSKKTFYITTPIYYPSSNLHIGHAYTTTIADTLARYKKMMGYDVFFLTGSDEHGEKIAEKAKEKGVTPLQFTTEVVKSFKNLWSKLGIDYDKFIRTTDKEHKEIVQEIVTRLFNDKEIYFGDYNSYYCISCEENFLSTEVIDRRCPRCERILEHKVDKTYFLQIRKHQKWIKALLTENYLLIPEERVNELVNSFIDKGLEDLSISRTTFDWGIKIKEDPKHVLYVWIDALSNYISALDFTRNDDKNFNKFWSKDSEIIHIVGKEITRFHCIYWPIILKDLGLRMPSKIIAHGWITTNSGKMSKSKGNVIDPIELIGEYNRDTLRYFLLKEIKIGSDSMFSLDQFKSVYNTDLANNIGNFSSRTLGMIKKYFNSELNLSESFDGNSFNGEFLDKINTTIDKFTSLMDNFKINEAIENVMELIFYANKQIEEQKPWELSKAGKDWELLKLMILLAQTARVYSVLLSPILIDASQEMKAQFNFSDKLLTIKELKNHWLLDGLKVSDSKPIFLRKE